MVDMYFSYILATKLDTAVINRPLKCFFFYENENIIRNYDQENKTI